MPAHDERGSRCEWNHGRQAGSGKIREEENDGRCRDILGEDRRMTYIKLKPCPWCGRPTNLIEAGGLFYVSCAEKGMFYYNCDRVAIIYYDSAEKAIAGWNNNESIRGMNK